MKTPMNRLEIAVALLCADSASVQRYIAVDPEIIPAWKLDRVFELADTIIAHEQASRLRNQPKHSAEMIEEATEKASILINSALSESARVEMKRIAADNEFARIMACHEIAIRSSHGLWNTP